MGGGCFGGILLLDKAVQLTGVQLVSEDAVALAYLCVCVCVWLLMGEQARGKGSYLFGPGAVQRSRVGLRVQQIRERDLQALRRCHLCLLLSFLPTWCFVGMMVCFPRQPRAANDTEKERKKKRGRRPRHKRREGSRGVVVFCSFFFFWWRRSGRWQQRDEGPPQLHRNTQRLHRHGTRYGTALTKRNQEGGEVEW